jgi:hypothetical protein
MHAHAPCWNKKVLLKTMKLHHPFVQLRYDLPFTNHHSFPFVPPHLSSSHHPPISFVVMSTSISCPPSLLTPPPRSTGCLCCCCAPLVNCLLGGMRSKSGISATGTKEVDMACTRMDILSMDISCYDAHIYTTPMYGATCLKLPVKLHTVAS